MRASVASTARLSALLLAARKARGDFEAAAAHVLTGDRHGDGVGGTRRKARWHADNIKDPPGALSGLSRWQRRHDCSPKPPVTFGYGPSLNAPRLRRRQIWYTGNAAGLIGKVDPKTRQGNRVQDAEPEGARSAHHRDPARRPHLLHGAGRELHRHPRSEGARWRDQAGRIADREFAALRCPPRLEGRAVPRYLQLEQNRPSRSADIDHSGVPLRDPKARPRRIAIGKDDTVWYGDYARGYLGHLDPKTGKVEEFQSPGGAESKPYAIDVTADGAVWYVETGDETKNVLVRFNPETKKFLTWAIPGGGGTVRNMEIDKAGNLWLAESGVGKIAKVTITVGKANAVGRAGQEGQGGQERQEGKTEYSLPRAGRRVGRGLTPRIITQSVGAFPGYAPRRLRSRRADRRRRDGGGLSRDGHDTGPPGRDQGPAGRVRRRSRAARPVRAGSARRSRR